MFNVLLEKEFVHLVMCTLLCQLMVKIGTIKIFFFAGENYQVASPLSSLYVCRACLWLLSVSLPGEGRMSVLVVCSFSKC